MKKITITSLAFILFCSGFQPIFANPLEGSFNRMNSALEQNGVANPNVSLGIKLHVPVSDPAQWSLNLDVPRKSMNTLCDKSAESVFGYSSQTKPCSINPNNNTTK